MFEKASKEVKGLNVSDDLKDKCLRVSNFTRSTKKADKHDVRHKAFRFTRDYWVLSWKEYYG